MSVRFDSNNGYCEKCNKKLTIVYVNEIKEDKLYISLHESWVCANCGDHKIDHIWSYMKQIYQFKVMPGFRVERHDEV